jgi:integrase
MARPTVGKVLEHVGKDGLTYRSLRFVAYGKRRFVALGAVSAEAAEKALRHVIADVERGTWQPARQVESPREPDPIPTFHEFAEDWWLRNEKQLAAKTRTDYRWRLECHLLPYFGEMPLDAITFDTVERYIAAKLTEGERIRAAAAADSPIVQHFTDSIGRERKRKAQPLSPRAINMTLILFAAILEGAVERGLIVRNPAKGRRRRVIEHAPRRSYLETAEQIKALLDAAGEIDREPTTKGNRQAIVAVFVFAGLRISELVALRWRDVDLAGGWLHTGSKTDAGWRQVKIRGALRDILVALKAATPHPVPDAYVFATPAGARPSTTKVRDSKLAPALRRASKRLIERDLAPLPEGITPHSLRRTFCSVLYALGEDPGVVMDEMGHTDPALALRIYRQAMRRGEDEKAALRALVEDGIVAVGGIQADSGALPVPEAWAA